jgi:SAM-dependent methyltransferase
MSPTTQTAIGPDLETPVTFYDRLYAGAEGDVAKIPWSDGQAHPALIRWLDVVAPRLIRCGGRVIVPACGFGADAREVARRGYDVIGFDAAPTAIDWARRLDPDGTVTWNEADLFEPPARWRHRFDLVVEVNTVQALPPDQRRDVLASMADLLAPHGCLLAIGRAAVGGESPDRVGPPWPVAVDELVRVAGEAGLQPDGEVHCFAPDDQPTHHCFRGLFRRPG